MGLTEFVAGTPEERAACERLDLLEETGALPHASELSTWLLYSKLRFRQAFLTTVVFTALWEMEELVSRSPGLPEWHQELPE